MKYLIFPSLTAIDSLMTRVPSPGRLNEERNEGRKEEREREGGGRERERGGGKETRVFLLCAVWEIRNIGKENFITQRFAVLSERVIPVLSVLPRGNFLINVKRNNLALQNNSATIKHGEIRFRDKFIFTRIPR